MIEEGENFFILNEILRFFPFCVFEDRARSARKQSLHGIDGIDAEMQRSVALFVLQVDIDASLHQNLHDFRMSDDVLLMQQILSGAVGVKQIEFFILEKTLKHFHILHIENGSPSGIVPCIDVESVFFDELLELFGRGDCVKEGASPTVLHCRIRSGVEVKTGPCGAISLCEEVAAFPERDASSVFIQVEENLRRFDCLHRIHAVRLVTIEVCSCGDERFGDFAAAQVMERGEPEDVERMDLRAGSDEKFGAFAVFDREQRCPAVLIAPVDIRSALNQIFHC